MLKHRKKKTNRKPHQTPLPPNPERLTASTPILYASCPLKQCSMTSVFLLPCQHPHNRCALKDFRRPDCSWNTAWECAITSLFSAVVYFFGLDRGCFPQTHHNLCQLQEISRCSTATISLARKTPDMKHSRQWAAALHLSRERTTEKSSQEGHDNNHAYELMQQQLGLAVNICFLYPPSPLFLLLYGGSGDVKPLGLVEVTASRVALLEQVGTKWKVMLSDPLLVVYWVTGHLFKAQGPQGEKSRG